MRRDPRPSCGPLLRVVPAAVLLALALTGCGSGDDDGGSADPSDTASSAAPASGAPREADVADFCEAFAAASAVGDEADTADQADAAHAAGGRLIETGTPSDMPKEAREGFELYADAIVDVTEDQVAQVADGNQAEAFEALGIDAEGQTKVQALAQYASMTCGGQPAS